MRKLLLLILLLVSSQVQAVDYIMIGRGGASCGQFNQDIKGSKQWEYIYYSWAEGYMSAINVRNEERFGKSINLSPTSFEGPEQLKFLKTYCTFNPDKSFLFGVMTLFEALGKE